MDKSSTAETTSTFSESMPVSLVPPPRKRSQVMAGATVTATPNAAAPITASTIAAAPIASPTSALPLIVVSPTGETTGAQRSSACSQKYSRSIGRQSSNTQHFKLTSTSFSEHEIGAETFTAFAPINPVVEPRQPVPLFFSEAETEPMSDSTACVSSQFLSPSPIQNFYDNYVIAKPYVRKSGVQPYYSKSGNRSDVSFSIEQRNSFNKSWGLS